jgi:hypothetical protein
MVASTTRRPSAEKTARAARKSWREYQADREVFAAGAAASTLTALSDRYRRPPMRKLGDGDRH